VSFTFLFVVYLSQTNTIHYIAQAIRHGKGVCSYPEAGGKLFRYLIPTSSTSTYHSSLSSYSGDWRDGKKTKGKFLVQNFSEYEGDFEGGEITGLGRRTWKGKQNG
jgi:hypothetical protein